VKSTPKRKPRLPKRKPRSSQPRKRSKVVTRPRLRLVSLRPGDAVDDPDERPRVTCVHRPRALTEAELFNVPAPAWEIEKRIEVGGFNVITGPRGIFKTFLLALLVRTVTCGGSSWLGAQAVRTGPVMVVPLEDLRGWRARWEAARRDAGIDYIVPAFTWPHPVNFFTGTGVNDLHVEADRLGIVHLIVDPWADGITGADENSQKDVGIALGRIKQLRNDGRSITIVHHTGHDESRERGSTVLGGIADTMLLLKRDRENGDGRVIVECSKMRNGERFAPVRLEFDKVALVLRPACVSLIPQLPKQQGTVLTSLRALNTNGSGVDIAAWMARCVKVEGMPRRTFFDAKKKLLDGGLVQESAAGRFQPA
jgi:hypothetical protein